MRRERSGASLRVAWGFVGIAPIVAMEIAEQFPSAQKKQSEKKLCFFDELFSKSSWV
jgi:hypothetical protein